MGANAWSRKTWLREALVWMLAAGLAAAQQQVAVPPGFSPRPAGPQVPIPPPPQRTPSPADVPPPAQAQQRPTGTGTTYGGLTLNNASLTEVIDLLARQLHMNYILDPRVKGGVILNTYGEIKNVDTRSLLEAILRINGFGLVQQGELFRIVPLTEISHQPLPPERVTNPKDIPEDDRTMLNLVFLKYVTADELAKVLDPFRGENSSIYSYAPANLLFILDSHRNMKRLMELIALFDNDTLANQRVRLYETKNGRPSDIVKELDSIVKSISLNEKSSPIKFLPVDRINTIVAVASNPGAFAEVDKWLKRLDVPPKAPAGAMENYVYRVKYGNAMMLAYGIMMLYGGGGYGSGMNPYMMQMMMGGMGGGMMGGMGNGMMGGMNPMMGGMMGGGMMGGGMMGGMNPYMMGGGMMGGMNPYMMGGGAYGGMYTGGGMSSPFAATPSSIAQPNTSASPSGIGTSTGAPDQTGQYLGNSPYPGAINPNMPRIVPNPFNNSLMIQAKAGDYEQIVKLLREMDVPPRQVLIDAKIYEIDLSRGFSSSIAAALQDNGTSGATGHHGLASLSGGGAVNLTDGFLVGRTKELLTAVQLLESEQKAKSLSAPSVIATDSIPATINVGVEVPVLTAQAVTGAQQNGTSLFANTVSNVSTGVTLSITAQVNPSGIVTMQISQDVSSPEAPAAGGIQSPSFSKRSVQTQVTVQDGDTIAIGGIIQESTGFNTTGIPGLNRLPVVGALFGSRSYSKSRTELVIFMTPRVIYDTNQIQEASEQLQQDLHELRRTIRDNQ